MWLTAADVLPLAGYPESHASAARALAYAEALIEQRTGLLWGASAVGEELRVRLSAYSYFLPLPKDVTAVSAVSPDPGDDVTLELGDYGLEQVNEDGELVVWEPRRYVLTVDRGILEPTEDVNKLASLLAAHFLGFSDPERSRYLGASQGDFGGTMRFAALPVPEAEAMIQPYVQTFEMALV